MRWFIFGCGTLLLSGCAFNSTQVAEPKETRPASAAPSRCLAGERNLLATRDYVGISEAEAVAQARQASGGRVVERDGDCLARTRDLRDGRVNLVVVGGLVTYAAVERNP